MPKGCHSADLFALPSVNGPFGLVYIKEMASGLPVVAPDETIQKNGFEGSLLCDVINTDEYAETIKRALTTDWQEKPRKNAHRFGWKDIADKYRDLILNVLEKSH